MCDYIRINRCQVHLIYNPPLQKNQNAFAMYVGPHRKGRSKSLKRGYLLYFKNMVCRVIFVSHSVPCADAMVAPSYLVSSAIPVLSGTYAFASGVVLPALLCGCFRLYNVLCREFSCLWSLLDCRRRRWWWWCRAVVAATGSRRGVCVLRTYRRRRVLLAGIAEASVVEVVSMIKMDVSKSI